VHARPTAAGALRDDLLRAGGERQLAGDAEAWNFSQMRGTPKKTVRLDLLEVVRHLLERLAK
jgi:hypothetical protein